jgi:hypothetical protein
MKTLVSTLIIFTALTSPLVCFAQSNAPVTRAEVRADLVKVEKAGYDPSVANDIHYPEDIEAAEAKIAAQDNRKMASDAVGGTTTGTSAAGARAHVAHYLPSSCVGPLSFCNIFFGN